MQRRGYADFFALCRDETVDEIGFGAAALENILRHRRALFFGARLRQCDQLIDDFSFGIGTALACARERLGIHHLQFLELKTERLADTHRLAAESDRNIARAFVEIALVAG